MHQTQHLGILRVRMTFYPGLYMPMLLSSRRTLPSFRSFKIGYENHSKDRQMGQKKSYQRKIQSSWFVKISVCVSVYRIFCSTCRGTRKFGLLSMPHKSAFLDDGFGNWKNALQSSLSMRRVKYTVKLQQTSCKEQWSMHCLSSKPSTW